MHIVGALFFIIIFIPATMEYCTQREMGRQAGNFIGVTLSIIFGIAAFILIVIVLLHVLEMRRRKRASNPDHGPQPHQYPTQKEYLDARTAWVQAKLRDSYLP